MNDQAALLRAILEAPADDAPRLVYADWLDEHGQPERAEFILVQVALSQFGPPPVVVTEPCVVEGNHGPDYFSLTGGEGTAGGGRLIMEVEAGDRVDVLKPRGRKGPLYGLRVHKITDDEVIVVHDAKSGPWAGASLRDREKALRRNGTPLPWIDGLHAMRNLTQVGEGQYNGKAVFTYEFARGFVWRIAGLVADFLEHAAAIFRAHPITAVRLTDRVPYPNGAGQVWYDVARGGVRSDLVPGAAQIPTVLFNWLAGWLPEHGEGRWRAYPTMAAANSALSAACVAFGRQQAGLSPL